MNRKIRKNTATVNANIFAWLKNLLSLRCLRHASRRLLSAFFIYALVFLPLLSIPGVIQTARGQIIIEFCNQSYATRIFQFCPLDSPVESALTEQAIDDVMALYELPASDRPLLLKHARSEVRAQIYVRLLELINKPNPTEDEQRAIAAFTQRIKEKRIEAAQKAKAEYDRFKSTSCRIYQPPSPYTYDPGYGCYSNFAGAFSSKSPSFEEFQNFGATLAYGDLFTPDAQEVSLEMSQGIALNVGIAAAGIGAGAAAAIGSTVTFGTLAAILPTAGVTFAATAGGTGFVAVLPAAGAASGAVGASAAAGPAAIIILALTAAVMEGINVTNQRELPDKLNQAIIDKQNETIDLRALVNGDDKQKQEVYGAFLRITLPEFTSRDAVLPRAEDPTFISSTPTSAPVETDSLVYSQWSNNGRSDFNEARLYGRSWFIVRNPSRGVPFLLRLSIKFLGENGELLTARRRGREFVISRPENPAATIVTDTLKTRFNDIVYSYKVKPSDPLAIAGNSRVAANCFYGIDSDSPEQFVPVTLGRILDTGGTPVNSLVLSVNGGASATVGNVTLNNLSIQHFDNTNYIVGRAVTNNNVVPATADFTIQVENFTETQTFLTKVDRTAIIDTLPAKLPNALEVGTNYTFELSTNRNISYLGQCGGYSYSVEGELPAGLSFVNNHQAGAQEPGNSDVRLVGTAGSVGDYRFTINKIYANGERLSRNYRMVIRGNFSEIPGGLKSWWRAENNVEDFTNRANGTLVGSGTFINGKVGRGFYFRGTNGYVQLPDNAFQIASGTQTFETWFKTPANGVILGRQNANITPYNNAQNLARPLIYVDNAGKLRVTFGNSAVISPNPVNNNAYHHVAVTFSESGGGAVYLDGVNIGANNARAYTAANQKFQFGTGFINPGVTGELSGWANFTGTIDEPAVYDQILSVAQIRAIYAAGAGGKITVTAIPTAPTQRDGNNGTITLEAQGGVPQLTYSIDNGATFKTTSFFPDLTPGTYQAVVRDGNGRDVRRTVTINNPPPTLSFTTEVTPPQCFGGNAQVVILPSGGSDNYEFSLMDGANRQTSNTFTDIGAGTYTPWLRDATSDTTYTNGTINIPQPAQIAVSPANFPNATLNQPYSRTFTVSGGTPGYSIGISGDVQTNFQLPAGLTSTVSGNSFTISGTPTQIGTFNLFFEIYDQRDCRQGIFAPPLTITSTATYGIAGKVTNGGQGLANATLTLAGAENRTTTTDANGNYSFATVAGSGNYTVTASLNGATFAQPMVALDNLNENLSGVDFATAATTYEADIAPRATGGDGAINVLDLVALGRILMPNNPDSAPASGAEYQRADSDPRSSRGNAVINNNDVVQLRRYIVDNLSNPLTPANGAIVPAGSNAFEQIENETVFPDLNPRVFGGIYSKESKAEPQTSMLEPARISAASVGVSGGVFMPIRLNSTGNTSAVQFTVIYNPNKLFVASVSGGQNAPSNQTLITNRDTPGKINVVAYLPVDGAAKYAAGDVQILTINFGVSQGATGAALVDFADAPVQRLASDANANPIQLNSTAGRVMITPTAANVRLGGRVSSGGGRGLANAIVRLTDQAGAIRAARTNSFGYYQFNEVQTGAGYVVAVTSKQHVFEPQIVTVNGEIADLDFNVSPR